MRRKSFLFFLLSLFIIYCSLLIIPAFSQESLALQISPALYELTLDPGETRSISDFEFFNPSEVTQETDILLYDFVVSDEVGGIEIVEESHTRYSLSRWLGVSPEEMKLGPRDHQKVDLTISVPDFAEPGGHYGVLFGKIKPPSMGGDITRVGISAGVAGPILLTVTGPISYAGEIIEFRKIPFVNLGPVNFLIRFKNEGTVHYQPHGTIEIFDWFGNKADVVTVPEKRAFPETIRQLPAVWNRRLLVGKYKARATIYFGAEDENKDVSEIEFWAFPYKPVLVMLAVLILLLVVGKIKKKIEERD
jgi:hypothetical protein